VSNLDRKAAHNKQWYDITKFILIAVTTVSTMIILSVLLLGVAKLQAVAANTNTTSKTLLDCTNPKGKCYKEGNARSAQAIGSINRVSIYAAYCAKIPANVTAKQIETCINAELQKEQK